ncbi:MAG: sodium transport system ATP-binding protein [Crocinitomicaceae bacterium]|jgi:sodium transport system ATP-binding protein
MIEVQNVSKQYVLSRKQRKELHTDETIFRAVNDVSFKCTPGRVFSLLGPNGAGKTTLLRIVSTILKASSGDVVVGGHSVNMESEKVRSKIGFLTGSTNLYARLTPEEIVKYFADLHHMDKSLFKERKEVLFDRLNINDFAKKRYGQLSVGMKQKVSIARSLIHDPEIIIFDEPTSGLDVVTAHNIVELIRQCKKEGKTVIFSSHIMSEVDLLCDDLAIMANGELLFNDSIDAFRKLSNNQSLTETFIQIVNKKSN